MREFLVGDVGGTHARLGLSSKGNSGIASIHVYSNKEFPNFEGVIEHYLTRVNRLASPPLRACFALASPLDGHEIHFSNNSWTFRPSLLQKQFSLQSLTLINDFEAIARSIPKLGPEAIVRIGEGPKSHHPKEKYAIVGPGTGLGMAGLFRDGTRWIPLASEGGHAAYAPFDEAEERIVRILRAELGFVSKEDLVSGQGLENLFAAISYREHGRFQKIPAKDISERAISQEDPLAVEALDRFCAMLGSVAGDLALTLGAVGGVYLAGGILPRFLPYLKQSAFRQRFAAKGRFASYLEAIPTYVMIEPYPGLIGAATVLDEVP